MREEKEKRERREGGEVQDRRRGHRSRAGEHQANGGDRSRTRRRGTRREARAESGQRLSGEAFGM